MTYFTSVFSNRRVTSVISSQTILWKNKPIVDNSILLWDLENIPFNRLNNIKKIVKYTPQDLYVITKQNLGEKLRSKINKEQFKILDAHKSISDDKIISIMKLYTKRTHMILISSDSDFVREANKYIKNNKLQWIILDANKKAIIMKIDISNKNLTLSTLSPKHSKKIKQNQKKIIKKPQNTTTVKIDSKYGIYEYVQYAFGVLKRSYYPIIKFITKLPTPTKNDKTIQSYKHDTKKISSTNKRKKISKKSYKLMRHVYRYNYKSKLVVCGNIYIYSKKQYMLDMYHKLQSKYYMPRFNKQIRFNKFDEVNHFIHYNEKHGEYFLNEFSRIDI